MQEALAVEETRVKEALARQRDDTKKSLGFIKGEGEQSLQKSLMIIGMSAVVIFLLAITVSMWIAKKISRPVVELTASAGIIAEGDYDVGINKSSDDEVGLLAERFDEMRQRVKTFTENLQELIEEKTKDIKSMLTNIEQGIFTITIDHTIHPEYSKHLEDIFETKDIGDQPFAEFMFSKSNLTSEQISCVKSIVLSSVGENWLNFSANKSHLPGEMDIFFGDNQKHLEIDWCPIEKDDCIEKIMVTVRDVTKLKELQAQSAQKEFELAIIQELLANENHRILLIFDQSRNIIQECLDFCHNPRISFDQTVELFRNLHTLKGLLRTYKLKTSSNLVHEIEEHFLQLKSGKSWTSENREKMAAEIQEVMELIDTYEDVNQNKLGRGKEEVSQIKPEMLSEIRSVISLYLNDADIVDDFYSKLEEILSNKRQHQIKYRVEQMVASLSDTAKELNKKPLLFLAEGDEVSFTDDVWHVLDGAFIHMVRNSLDHGIETVEDRLAAGKEVQGRIFLKSSVDNDNIVMRIWDDGRGLNLWKIRTKAGLGNDVAPVDIAKQVFSASFSTADKVSDISGRGVGLDAVQANVEKLGGSIQIDLTGLAA